MTFRDSPSGHWGLFVTGTDTGVGKTVVTAALCHCLRRQRVSVGVMKPIETGVAPRASGLSDAVRLQSASGSTADLSLIRPYRFRDPVAPLAAARAERNPIRLAIIMRQAVTLRRQHAFVIVEGVGGIHVPLTQSEDVLDLIVRIKLPVLIVGRAGLGGINHARLTIDALQRRNVSIAALVLNRTVGSADPTSQRQERSTAALLRELEHIPVIGPLPYLTNLHRDWHKAVLALSKTAGIRMLAAVLAPFAK
jgi:dethiobiotin synthetase